MLVFKIVLYLALLGYLFRQAAMDAKTGLVIKKYNNVALALAFCGMIFVLTMQKPVAYSIIPEILIVCGMLFLISSDFSPKALKIMQKADAKAFATVYFSSFVIFNINVAVGIFCFSLFFANIFFMIWHHIIRKEKVHFVSNVHKPYFPFILSGYFITTLSYIFLSLCYII